MDHKQMKIDIFTIKALESKGFVLEEVLALPDQDIEKLQLPARIINEVIEYKKRGVQPAEVLKEVVTSERLIDDSTVEVSPIIVEQYVVNTEEQNIIAEEVKVEFEESNPIAEDEVEIIREVADQEDIQIIKDALNDKELKTIAAYTKHLKSVVPASILDDVDSTIIAGLIDARIAEVKNTK